MKKLISALLLLCLVGCGSGVEYAVPPPPPPPPPAAGGDAGTCSIGDGGFGAPPFGSVGSVSCAPGSSGSATLGKSCRYQQDCGVGESCIEVGFGNQFCVKDCQSDSECGPGGRCLKGSGQGKGACLHPCSNDSQCPGSFVCTFKAPDTGKVYCGPDRLGTPCIWHRSCQNSSYICLGSPGYASGDYGVCTTSCANDPSVCGKHNRCVKVDQSVSICLRPCTSPTDCGLEQQCKNGYCLPLHDSQPWGDGSACTNNSQCDSNFCDTTYSGGYCTRSCRTDDDCSVGAACVVVGGSSARCLEKCFVPGEQSTCRDGYFCYRVTGQTYGVCDKK